MVCRHKQHYTSQAVQAQLLGQPTGLTHPHLMQENEREWLTMLNIAISISEEPCISEEPLQFDSQISGSLQCSTGGNFNTQGAIAGQKSLLMRGGHTWNIKKY